MYSTFPGIQGYKIWESNNFDYIHPNHFHSFDKKPEKPKHKYQVNDVVLDVVEGKVGCIQELLSWPKYLVVDSSTPTKSWICNESHLEPLAEDIDESGFINESSPSMKNLDIWEEEPTQYIPLSTGITDITTTGDITISKRDDFANDGGICATNAINKHDKDIEELTHISDINMQKTTNIEEKTYDIERRVCDIEKKQKKISKLSKLALLSRFL